MKYNQYALQNEKGEYIQYPTAYRANPSLTNSLYDVHLWILQEDAQKLADYINKNQDKSLEVILV